MLTVNQTIKVLLFNQRLKEQRMLSDIPKLRRKIKVPRIPRMPDPGREVFHVLYGPGVVTDVHSAISLLNGKRFQELEQRITVSFRLGKTRITEFAWGVCHDKFKVLPKAKPRRSRNAR